MLFHHEISKGKGNDSHINAKQAYDQTDFIFIVKEQREIQQIAEAGDPVSCAEPRVGKGCLGLSGFPKSYGNPRLHEVLWRCKLSSRRAAA